MLVQKKEQLSAKAASEPKVLKGYEGHQNWFKGTDRTTDFPFGMSRAIPWSQLPMKPLHETKKSLSELPKGTRTTSTTPGSARGRSRAKRSTQLPPEHLSPWEAGMHQSLWGAQAKALSLDGIILLFLVL